MKDLILTEKNTSELRELCDKVVRGEEDALKVYRKTSAIEKEILAANKILKPYAKDEAAKYSKPELVEMGIELRSGAGKVQYKEDAEWCRINALLKEREALVKAATKASKPIYDEEGVKVDPVTIKYNAESLIIKS